MDVELHIKGWEVAKQTQAVDMERTDHVPPLENMDKCFSPLACQVTARIQFLLRTQVCWVELFNDTESSAPLQQ